MARWSPTRYTTVNLVKTIEAVLGLRPMGLNDALAAPMADVFDTRQADWTFTAQVPAVLRTTQLPLPPPTTAEAGCPRPAATLVGLLDRGDGRTGLQPARTGSTRRASTARSGAA